MKEAANDFTYLHDLIKQKIIIIGNSYFLQICIECLRIKLRVLETDKTLENRVKHLYKQTD